MKKPIADQVVVVTGASSGIGREVTIQLVNRGATVVAVARDLERLEALAASLALARGRIEVATADVAVWEQVRGVAEATVQQFGRIDTWVNNAAVSMYATVADSTVEEIARVIEVNLLGQVHGVKAALPAMQAQGRGTIINVASVLAGRSVPLQSAYCASKHGVQGFMEALRMELQYQSPGIDVTVILPSSMNTPLFSHALSKLGVMPKPIPPIYAPQVAADAIVFAAEHPRRDIVAGGAGKALLILQRLCPDVLDWYMTSGGRFFRKQRTLLPDDGQNNLFSPVQGPGEVRGIFGEDAARTSLYTRIFEYYPRLKSATAALIGPWALGPVIRVLAGMDIGLAALRAMRRRSQ
ncbi:MAG: SDR family NAD(P)-dependent oxidoreductase [Nannocystis sp.]|nr:SDR family oxidoreductase [Nannocystis sp.]MBA3549242.1 SDR family NAD(P)-dependent oxidoreductase [Nannocystis sp.]